MRVALFVETGVLLKDSQLYTDSSRGAEYLTLVTSG